ncbi:MAG: tRNA (adenosine(37)-N6)-dimethylallyltransferase MiaA [Actinobacteria bacterium]|nr:MAG: tRNA (adenosine(37)-N6)-dimethylallyltransferase MiaA [Actinomycetota bacterium]
MARRPVACDVIAVFGPTASGKSRVAEALADELGTEVVSADAMQAYRGLPILTNQPEPATRLVGVWPLSHEGSVGEYQRLAHEALDDLVARHGRAVVAGGTGLYLRAALADIDLPPAPRGGDRARSEREYDADPERAYARLAEHDPRAAARLHPNDRRRVVRALELMHAGTSLAPQEDRLWSAHTRLPSLVIGLDVPPDELERRIVARTDEMFERGVVEEVRSALEGAVSKTAEKALGLREIDSLSADDARDRIVARTRQYAAYQRKWMRRIPGLVMVDATRPTAEVVDAILEVARAR